ncbi:hypothetical protein PGT21_002640 [Puccinia graminis f. sp. tritici]|uniref:Uncharacterized protein n=1 Tax=Puccinia graminis f. sp. tritici TaxID=56615 RepID=A0A5B0P5V4_PUCGR|nr:hypothetical protein PGT21_002640 [Puccinia graminis f. sp. tritici]KAA1137175.1 hypothetical protein PGTUg99_010709 [Puccinia graminis f. sp. tritici]
MNNSSWSRWTHLIINSNTSRTTTSRLLSTNNNNNTNKPLQLLIQHALLHRHLDPIQFQRSSSGQAQLDNLLLGSLILNDHRRANYYLNRIEASHSTHQNDQFYPNLFKVCGLIGRGMGMMRRVVKAQLSASHSNQRPLRPAQIKIIEAYIENLIRWTQIERAWSLLASFDFGPSIDLSLQAELIGGRFSKRVKRIKKPPDSNKPLWKPNSSAYSSLLSIYLILDRPDLALKLNSNIDLSKIDPCMALLVCARASTSSHHQEEHPLQFDSITPPGPITTTVLAKYIYRKRGPIGFIRWLEQQTKIDSSNRILLSAWLDILLLPSEPALEPVELAEWIERIDQHDLLGERELERYLRYTREWLESQANSKIRLNLSQRRWSLDNPNRHPSIDRPISIDPDDPRLGYPQLINLFKKVYHQKLPSSSSSSRTTTSENNEFIKPSTVVVSEMVRILSLIGTPPGKLTELLDREVQENQSQIRSTHMIGLIWSKIVNHDLNGLNTLIDKEMKLKYKLVLTGLLTTIILAGLIATRAPKPMIIKISQKLIEQCPTTSPSNQPNPQNYYKLNQHTDLESVESYLNLIKAAEAVGDLILIKELHESLVAKFGRETFFGTDRPVSIDYLHLIFQAYMKLNEPLLAQTEVSLWFESLQEHYLASIPLADPPPSLPSSTTTTTTTTDREESKRFLSSGVLQDFLDSQPGSKLIESDDLRGDGADERQKYGKFLESLTRSSMLIAKKLDSLGRLRRLFARTDPLGKEKGEEEWEAARLAEIQARLLKFRRAQELNLELIIRFQSFLPCELPSPSSSAPITPKSPIQSCNVDGLDDQLEPLEKTKSSSGPIPHHRRDLDWNKAMALGLGLVRKLLD